MNHEVHIYILAFFLSLFSGLAYYFQSCDRCKMRRAASIGFYTGMLGLGMAMLWRHFFAGHPQILLGLCVMAGLGGPSMWSAVLFVARVSIDAYTKQAVPGAEASKGDKQ